MQVWQHVGNMDHLRRSAESKIQSARGSKASSAASSGYYASARDAIKQELKDGLQVTPGLADMSSLREH